jgi:hypothetical protein
MSVSDAVAAGTDEETNRTLTVTATYFLSEEGRKMSLLDGGNGHALQELTIEVPVSRLHLVNVDSDGVARLKLRPRYQLAAEGAISRVDVSPTYDAPPRVDDLFREAARNHELEEAFHTRRRAVRTKRRDTDRERRAQTAQAFLADPSRRALVHPAPTEKRCYVSSQEGRVLFDADKDEGPARQIPAEAHRRFRADLRDRKERNREIRAAQLAAHDVKKRFVDDWIARHGTQEQRQRQVAGMMPMDEAIEAITDHAFAPLGDRPVYTRDGVARLQAHVRSLPLYASACVTRPDLEISSANATRASAAQWGIVQDIQRALPGATALLRQHRLVWKQESEAPALTLVTVLVTMKFGPFTLRREYDATV